jgi:hypothetical protein
MLNGQRACYLAYVGGATGWVLLVNDAGDAGGPYPVTTLPGIPSEVSTLQNSECTFSVAGSSASVSGNTLTLTLALTFSQRFRGNQIIYAAARNSSQNSNWQPVGTWTIQ